MSKFLIALLVLASISHSQARDKQVTYVGGGRHSCTGNCNDFNREQREYNFEMERIERYQSEDRRDARDTIESIRQQTEDLYNEY